MTEPEYEPQPGPVVKVARDLTEIERLAPNAEDEAEHASGSRLMPGGRAMVHLSPVANLEAWENMTATTERIGRAYTSAEDEDPEEAWSPFQILVFWSEQWRVEHGQEFEPAPHRPRPTLATEANFLRWLLPWARENLMEWDDFARDIRRARLKTEDIVHAGSRAERSHIQCPHCDEHPRLIRKYALLEHELPAEEDVRWWHLVDHWRCPNSECRHRFDDAEFKRVHAHQLKSEGAERYVPLTDAVDTLRSQGRPERTIRKWLQPIEDDPEHVVHGYCEVRTRRTLLWWPDLWTRHLLTQTRERLKRSA